MTAEEIWLVCVGVLAFALVSHRAARASVSAPMVFIALGLVLSDDVAGAVQIDLEAGAVAFLTELTLAVILFSDASRVRLSTLRADYSLPLRLLAIGLPLGFAANAAVTGALFGSLGFASVAIVGAILAPTDAALGQQVVSDPTVPGRVRQALNVESGLNDGLAVPLVAVFTAMLADEQHTAAHWVTFVFEQIGYGVVVGLATGAIGAWALRRARRAGTVDAVFGQIAVALIPVIALTGAEAIEGNGFIAAFVAGVAFGGVAAAETSHMTEYTEDTAQALAVVAFFLFGNIAVGPGIEHLSWRVVLAALVILTVARMVPVAIALVGSGVRPPTVAFLGWFGPRGLASIVFGLGLAEEELLAPDSPVLGVITWTVVLSVVLHGASAAPAASAYGRWWGSHSADVRDTMIEASAGPVGPVRWARRHDIWSRTEARRGARDEPPGA